MEHYTYDEAGNLTETMDGNSGKIRFLYNSQNRLEQRIDQAGEAEYWNYDTEGRCCLYKNRNGQEIAYSYNMLGSLLSRICVGEEALTESYGYTPEGSLACLNTLMGEEQLVSNRYAYDHNGNCIRKETLAGVTEYGYDVMNRLSEQSGPFGRECYTYDYVDNRTGREWFAAVECIL